MNPGQTDVAIIGAGPIGVELHAALAHRGARIRHLEAGRVGHTFSWWPPNTPFFSSAHRIAITGKPVLPDPEAKPTGEAYAEYLQRVAEERGLAIETGRAVRRVRRAERGFELDVVDSTSGIGGGRSMPQPPESASAELVCAERLVLAIGNMHAPRLLGVPGENRAILSHYVRAAESYAGRRVVIVGGKNSAVESTLRLHHAGARVTVSYRRPAFDADRIKPWILPELLELIGSGAVAFLPSTTVRSIDDAGVTLEAGSTLQHVPADDVLALTGYVQDQSLFDQLGLDRLGDMHRPMYDHATMETSVPGVYVAGTASGGSQQRARVFIENSHVHVDRICRAITGQGVPWEFDARLAKLPEHEQEQ